MTPLKKDFSLMIAPPFFLATPFKNPRHISVKFMLCPQKFVDTVLIPFLLGYLSSE